MTTGQGSSAGGNEDAVLDRRTAVTGAVRPAEDPQQWRADDREAGSNAGAAPPGPGQAEPDSSRFRRLNLGLSAAVRSTLAAFSVEHLARSFPSMARANRGALQSAQAQILEYLTDSIMKEFDTVITRRGVKAKLDEIDRITAKAEKGTVFTRPTPEAAVAARVVPLKRAHLAQLRARLLEYQNENSRLATEAVDCDDRLKTCREYLERMMKELEEAATIACREFPMHDMRTQADILDP